MVAVTKQMIGAIALGVLAGCADTPIIKTMDHGTVLIKWPAANRTREAVRQHCAPGERGCAFYSADDFICEVFAEEPGGIDDFRRLETMGHELVHCVFGKGHK